MFINLKTIYIQLGRAQTLVDSHLNAYEGQVTFFGHGFGWRSSDARPVLKNEFI
jgi:hypothetical protein